MTKDLITPPPPVNASAWSKNVNGWSINAMQCGNVWYVTGSKTYSDKLDAFSEHQDVDWPFSVGSRCYVPAWLMVAAQIVLGSAMVHIIDTGFDVTSTAYGSQVSILFGGIILGV